MHRATLRCAAAFVGAVMLETACGLPDSYYLQPPISTAQANPTLNFFTFSNPLHDLNHDINVNFTGDEICYKLYSDPSLVDINAYVSSNSADASTQLTGKGFFPVCFATDAVGSRTDPVIPVDSSTAAAGSSITVHINQPPGTGAASYYVLSSTNGYFRRDTTNTSNGTVYKTFQQNSQSDGTAAGNGFTPGDTDFAAIQGNTFSGFIYVAWYAISFGYTLSQTPVRSAAVYLGYMEIPYP
jgi:hypothetical protein